MHNESMANFICELRKSNNLTQKQLAEKLNITDKAVSKWERGLGYPDISILSLLAENLGVTTNELLNGKRSSAPPKEVNKTVETTLQYAKKVTLSRKESVKSVAKVSITVTFLLGLLICIICDLAITGTFTWSLYPIASISFAWLIIIPLFLFKKRSVCMSLASLSIFIIPFLSILNKIISNTKFILSLGIQISLIAIAYIWIVFALFSIKKVAKWSIAAISVLLGIPVSLSINFVISKFTHEPVIDVWDVFSCGVLMAASIILLFIGKKRITKKR